MFLMLHGWEVVVAGLLLMLLANVASNVQAVLSLVPTTTRGM